MRYEPLALADACVVDVQMSADERGGFARTYCEDEFAAHGLPTRFVQLRTVNR